jgi:hypothetical protein
MTCLVGMVSAELRHSFNGSDGSNPQARLVQGTDGDFYGSATVSGSRACGGVGSGASCSMSKISYRGYRFPPTSFNALCGCIFGSP